MFLIYHVTSRDHVFKGLRDLMGWSFSYYATFSGHRPRGSSDTTAKIFYVTLEDHVIKVPGDVTEENSSLHILILPKLITVQEPIKVSYYPAKFGGHRHCGN